MSQGYRRTADAGGYGIRVLFCKKRVLAASFTFEGAWIRCGYGRESGTVARAAMMVYRSVMELAGENLQTRS
jgi:hypothetical protein